MQATQRDALVSHPIKVATLETAVERVTTSTHDAAVLAAHATLLQGVTRRVEQMPATQPRGGTHVALVVQAEGVKAALAGMGRVTLRKAPSPQHCTVAGVPT